MTLGKFRELTATMPDDLQMRFCTGALYKGDVIVLDEEEYEVYGVDVVYSDAITGFLLING